MMGPARGHRIPVLCFRLEDHLPQDHLLRLIDQHVDLSFVRERLKAFYSSTGRPSIHPEVLLRFLLIGCIVTKSPSERRLLEKWRCALRAYRWFTRLDLRATQPLDLLPGPRHGHFRSWGISSKISRRWSRHCSPPIGGRSEAGRGRDADRRRCRPTKPCAARAVEQVAQVSSTGGRMLPNYNGNPVQSGEVLNHGSGRGAGGQNSRARHMAY